MNKILLFYLLSFIAPAFAQEPVSKTKLHDFSVWLIPARQDFGYFQNVIEKFAGEVDAPVFRPHVTVFFGQTDSLERVKQIVGAYARNTGLVRLKALGVGVTGQKYKSLFVIFDNDDYLAGLSSAISNAAVKNDYRLQPHLSLLYKDMPIAEKGLLQQRFHLEVSNVTFDRIEVIREDDPDIVSQWIPVFVQDLVGQ